MLVGAFACNVVWGIIDGIFYLMDSLSARGHAIATLRKVREAADRQQAHQVIAGALPPVLASVLADGDLEVMRQKLNQVRIPERVLLTARNWRGAFGVMSMVFLATLPFVFVSNVWVAFRLSNAVAIATLLGLGMPMDYTLIIVHGAGPSRWLCSVARWCGSQSWPEDEPPAITRSTFGRN